MVENNTIIMISRKWFKVKRVCNFNAKPFCIKQEMNEFKEMIELSEAKKTAMSKIRGSGDLEDQRKRVLAFGDQVHTTKIYDKDYWKDKSEQQEKIPGMSVKDWKTEVWDKITPPTNPLHNPKLKVYGLANGQFLINSYWVNGPVLIFPKRFYMWGVNEPEEIKPHTLEVLNYVKPRPDYFIIGTGAEPYNFHPGFLEHFEKMGIKVDICKTFVACSTFNSCNEDDVNVACGLFPSNI